MASAVLAAVGGAGLDILTNSLSSLAQAGSQSILQQNEFQYNQALQQNSFQHDKAMLAAQVQATKELQGAMIGIKRQALLAGGFSDTDAARGSIGAPMTKLVDWNGTRYWAPGAMSTTTFSGTPTPILRTPRSFQTTSPKAPPSLYSSSWGAPQASRSTVTSRVSSSSLGSQSLGTVSSRSTVGPFLPGSLRIAPSPSLSSSVSSVSTVNQSLLDSWKPSTRRMPLFANLRRGHAE
ncbi:VP2 [Norovirus GVII]|nr:VP2 [Norovirus GVII]